MSTPAPKLRMAIAATKYPDSPPDRDVIPVNRHRRDDAADEEGEQASQQR
jgi:hypothetical protein